MHHELASTFLEPVQWVNRRGVAKTTVKSTTSLNVGEFAGYLDAVNEVGQKLKVTLPQPDYYGYEWKEKA
jgi:hypothetical protein